MRASLLLISRGLVDGQPHPNVGTVVLGILGLQAAKKQGMKTAFVARPTEYGPGQSTDLRPDATGIDYAPRDFVELAARLGC